MWRTLRLTRRRVAEGLLAALCVASAWQSGRAAAAERDIVEVHVRSLATQRQTDVPVSFGHVFRRGDVAPGNQVHVFLDGRFVQLDRKRTYDDGSLRYAVLSLIVPELGAGESRTLKLVAAPPRPSPEPRPVMREELLATDFDTVVTLTFPDGTVRTASARKILEAGGDGARTWLRGDAATEWLLDGPPVDDQGRPDEDLNVQFQVRAYRGCRRVRVSVVVENCWDHWAGNVRYDVRVTSGGREVFSRRAVDHRRLSRWRKVFWWGGEEPAVQVIHELGYLSSTGAVPNYDRSLELPEPDGELARQLAREGPRYEIMGRGSLTAYMPTTGGRPEIGSYPAWTVRYLLGMDPREKALVLVGGDLAGSWPIHVRAKASGRIMTIDARPEFWLDQRGKDRPEWKPDRHAPAADQVRLHPDMAHQPSLAYVPYLVTGDYYYLEEAYFWANYCLLSTWPHPRRDAEGILSGQIRGNAWSLRNIADAATIAPNGDSEKDYFDEKLRNNIADRVRRMLGPPEYNKLGFKGPRTTENARIQNPANPRWIVTPPWEHDYLIWSLHHLVELGYAEAARPRDFLLRWRVGTLTHAPDYDPMLATPYRMVVGEQDAEGRITFYDDWRKLGQENARLSKPDLPNYGNSYAYSARAACACGIDGGFPDAEKALRWLEENLPGHREVMARNPVWAIVPGGAGRGR